LGKLQIKAIQILPRDIKDIAENAFVFFALGSNNLELLSSGLDLSQFPGFLGLFKGINFFSLDNS